MLEVLGVLYSPLRDLYSYYKGRSVYPEEKKLIDINWPVKSGFQEEMKRQGWAIAFTRPDLVASRELEGYQVVFEVDEKNKKVYRLVLRDDSVLIGKKLDEAKP